MAPENAGVRQRINVTLSEALLREGASAQHQPVAGL